MMPTQINNVLKCTTICSKFYIHTMEAHSEKSTTNSLLSDIQECFENMTIVSQCPKKSCDESNKDGGSQILCSANNDTHAMKYLEFDSNSSHPSSDSLECLTNSEQFVNNFDFKVSNFTTSCCKKNVEELSSYSFKQLQAYIEDLTQKVEQVSSELVQLLLENDALQQESDARNIAIEQLLKMTVKTTESELKPIQMSVILPDDDDDNLM